jgi:hypothetical protein
MSTTVQTESKKRNHSESKNPDLTNHKNNILRDFNRLHKVSWQWPLKGTNLCLHKWDEFPFVGPVDFFFFSTT